MKKYEKLIEKYEKQKPIQEESEDEEDDDYSSKSYPPKSPREKYDDYYKKHSLTSQFKKSGMKGMEFFEKPEENKLDKTNNKSKPTKEYNPDRKYSVKLTNENYEDYFKRVRLVKSYKNSNLSPKEFYKLIPLKESKKDN